MTFLKKTDDAKLTAPEATAGDVETGTAPETTAGDAETAAPEATADNAEAVAAPPNTSPEVTTENDADDPAFESLTIEPTQIEKTWRISTKDRHFYAGWRYPLIIGGPLLMITGGTMLLVSLNQFKDAERDWDSYQKETISESKWDKIKLVNTLGWVLGGVGVGALVLFLATPRSREKIKSEKEAALRKQTSRLKKTNAIEFDIGVMGNGLILQGSF